MFAGSKTVSSERNDYIMKATGIVRRIDDLGRVVIPKEIRRTMRIREGTPLEIYTSVDGEVIFRKYSPVGEISGTADQYADVLYKVGGMPTVICDRDHVIAASGIQKKEVLERRVSSSLEDLIEQRKSLYRTADGVKMNPIEGVDRFAVACAPIMADGDVNGAVIMLSDKENSAVDDKQRHWSKPPQCISETDGRCLKNVPTGENIACGYIFCLFSEHHISKLNYILAPECHIVTAAAFKVNVRYIVSVQNL